MRCDTPLKIHLGDDARRAIAGCIRASGGREICGFLLDDQRAGQRFIAVQNAAAARDRFLVPNVVLARVRREAIRSGSVIAAFVHSHPNTLELSEDDLASLAHSPFQWIVVLLRGDALHYAVHCGNSSLPVEVV